MDGDLALANIEGVLPTILARSERASPPASFVANPWSMPLPFVVSLDPRYAEELCGLSVLASQLGE